MARAAEKVADKAKAIVAHQLEADPADIELRDGKWIVRGSPEKGMALADVAGAAYVPENLPDGMEPGLDETAFYDPENFVFPFGAHACVVDVDAETGKVEIVRYVAVDDCGPAINPMLIDGQVHGGITHGVGQALLRAGPLRRGRPARDRLVRRLRAGRPRRSCRATRPTAPRRRPRSTRSASRASARRARSPGRLR